MPPDSPFHKWESYEEDAVSGCSDLFCFHPETTWQEQSLWDPFQGIITGKGSSECRGWGHRGQKKETVNACKAISRKHLFWLSIIVTFAAIQCILPRKRLYYKWESFSFDPTKARLMLGHDRLLSCGGKEVMDDDKAGIHMGSSPTILQPSCWRFYMYDCNVYLQ